MTNENKLSIEREKIYNDLESKVTNTPLTLYNGEVPNGNKIWIKRECDSLFGAHYDFPYLMLFKHYESTGEIKPGDNVFESTSGSAGVSCAGIAKALGYNPYIVVPPRGEKAREEAIINQGATLDFTNDPNKYVNGFLEYVKRFLVEKKRENTQMFFLNHSMGKTKEELNETVLKGFERISTESISELEKLGLNIDYYVPGLGNGSTLVGPGRVFDKNKTKIIGFEPFQSALVYSMLHPEEYEKKYGIEPGTLPRHILPGLTFQEKGGKHVPTPTYTYAVKTGLIDDVVLLSDKFMDKEYNEITGRKDTLLLPHWDKEVYSNVGRSTLGGISVCKKLAENVSDKNFLIIGYDHADRYDVLKP